MILNPTNLKSFTNTDRMVCPEPKHKTQASLPLDHQCLLSRISVLVHICMPVTLASYHVIAPRNNEAMME